ncbi:hypothetical protein IAD21_00419 [Abditibacteriota bacterium]|nr:hypothetical protein IAD21_00419 [Abditibacteriota bacterium]
MKIRLYLLAFAVGGMVLWSNGTPIQAQGTGTTAPAETVKSVGSANWRIGSPVLSTGIYVEAPANLAVGGVEWKGANFFSSYSAQNESVRVELARDGIADFDSLKKATFERVGGVEGAAKAIKVASYEGLRLENDGKIAIVLKYGSDVWATVFLPQSAPDARQVALRSASSLWLERREAPQWKDRAIGTTSFQADLPFELELRSSDGDTVSKSVRWNNFKVDAIEWRAGNTDLEGTVRLQIESLQNQKGIENVRVRQVDRAYSWGFLENGERGKFVQLDYTEGNQHRRIYKIFSVAGTRVVTFQLTLDADDARHLLAAHRILGTARLGWTDSREFTPQKVAQEKFELESDSPFRQTANQGLRAYTGTDPLALLIVVPLDKPVAPDAKEINGGAQTLVDVGIKALIEAAGGQLTKSRIEPLVGTPFPTRRVVFEARIKDRWINGDAALIFYSNKVVMPLRLTESASSDFARRWATTFRGDSQTNVNWAKREFGGVEVIAPPDTRLSADGSELSGNGDGVKFIIRTVYQAYKGAPNFNPGPNETSPITTNEIDDALGSRSGEVEDALRQSARKLGVADLDGLTQVISAGNAYGMAGWYASGDTQYPRLDLVTLYDGNRAWTMELRWNPAQASSAQTRDAILSSLWAS